MRLLVLLLMLWCSSAFGITVVQPSSGSSSGSSTLTNGQVQATNIAPDSIGPAQTTAQMQYVTNSAGLAVSVPTGTNQWFKVATLASGSVGNPTYIRVHWNQGTFNDMRMVIETWRKESSNPNPQFGLISFSSRETWGCGAVGSDGSGGIYVSITNASGASVEGVITSAGYCPASPDARPTLVVTSNSVSDVNSELFYLTPGYERIYAPSVFVGGDATLATGTVNAAQGAFSTSLTLGGSNVMTATGSGGTNGLKEVLAADSNAGNRSGIGFNRIIIGSNSLASAGMSNFPPLLVHLATNDPATNWFFPGNSFPASFLGDNAANGGTVVQAGYAGNDAISCAEFTGYRAGGTIPAPTACQPQWDVQKYAGVAMGSNGIWQQVGYMQFNADSGFQSAGGAADGPGRWTVALSPDGSDTPTPRITALASDLIGIGSANTSPVAALDIKGVAGNEFTLAMRGVTNSNNGIVIMEEGANKYELFYRGASSRSLALYNYNIDKVMVDFAHGSNTVIFQSNVIVRGTLYTPSNSIYVGQTHLGETELKQVYSSRKLTGILSVIMGLLVVNFIRDRRNERRDRNRDAAQSRRLTAIEKKLGME